MLSYYLSLFYFFQLHLLQVHFMVRNYYKYKMDGHR